MQKELSEIIEESFRLIDEQNYKSAIEILSAALENYPDNIEILILIAKCYYLMGEKEKANEIYENAFEINNNSTLVLDPIIEIQIENEKYNKAEYYANFYLNCEDKDYAIQKYLETLLKIKHYDGIENFVENNTDDSILNTISLGLIAKSFVENSKNIEEQDKKSEKIENAKKYAKEALALDKNNIKASCALAQCYLEEDNFTEMERHFNITPQAETSPEFLKLYGEMKYAIEDYASAIDYFSKAIKTEKNNEELYYDLSMAYAQQGWHDEAETTIKQAIALDEKNVRNRLGLANIYYLEKEYDKTLLTLSYIHELEPENTEMNVLYVYTYAKQENFEKANEYAQKLDGKVELNYLNSTLASIYFYLGKKEAAYKKIDEAIEKEPENEQLLMLKASFLNQEEKNDEIIELYDKVIEKNPNYVDAYYKKALIYYVCEENCEKALEDAKKAVEMDCNNAEYQFLLAKIYSTMEKYDKALEHAKISLSIMPNDIEKYYFIGSIYLQKKDSASANSYFKEILIINPQDFEFISAIAKILEENDEIKYAYDYYQKAYRVNPYDYDFIIQYSDFVIKEVDSFKGIKILLNFSHYSENKNLKIESRNRAKRLIKENQKDLTFKEKLQLMFK